jgi:hypothetical protein
VNADSGQDADVSVSTDGSAGAEASADSDSGPQHPDRDAAIDDAAPFDVTGGDTEKGDAVPGDTASDRQGGDVGTDSTAAGDGAFADALDSASDADTSPPDATTGPTFSNCTYTNAIGAVPYAIIDATASALTPPSGCHCSWMYAVAEHRVLCGSVPPERVVSLFGCLAPAPGRSIIIIDPLMCLASLEFMASSHPLQDWDALLAEQIAGHADSGSTDVGSDDGMAPDSPADSASDGASPDSDSAAGD